MIGETLRANPASLNSVAFGPAARFYRPSGRVLAGMMPGESDAAGTG